MVPALVVPQLVSAWLGRNKPGLGRGGWHSAHVCAEVIAGMWAEAAARCLLGNAQGQNREGLLVWGWMGNQEPSQSQKHTWSHFQHCFTATEHVSKHVWRTVFSHSVQHVIFDLKFCFRKGKKIV